MHSRSGGGMEGGFGGEGKRGENFEVLGEWRTGWFVASTFGKWGKTSLVHITLTVNVRIVWSSY